MAQRAWGCRCWRTLRAFHVRENGALLRHPRGVRFASGGPRIADEMGREKAAIRQRNRFSCARANAFIAGLWKGGGP